MKIGELARIARCTVETVRYYEKEGLLPAPERTAGNYRSYGPQHAERLRFIRNCRSLDMNHGEIRTLLDLRQQPDGSCAGVNQLLESHIMHVADRIAELQRLQAELQELRSRCQDEPGVESCGILHDLATRNSGKKGGGARNLC